MHSPLERRDPPESETLPKPRPFAKNDDGQKRFRRASTRARSSAHDSRLWVFTRAQGSRGHGIGHGPCHIFNLAGHGAKPETCPHTARASDVSFPCSHVMMGMNVDGSVALDAFAVPFGRNGSRAAVRATSRGRSQLRLRGRFAGCGSASRIGSSVTEEGLVGCGDSPFGGCASRMCSN
jgi:hypothetical protein